MIKFDCNFYSIKRKVSELITTTRMGFEEDEELVALEKLITVELNKLLAKNKQISSKKKSVFFVQIDGAKWLEGSGTFKEEPQLVISEMKYSPAEMKRINKMRDAWDKKNSLTADPGHLALLQGENRSSNDCLGLDKLQREICIKYCIIQNKRRNT